MKTVLIVEDDEAIRVSLAYSLRKEGYEVWTAQSGMEALMAVHQGVPDIILLDVMLPDLDGFEVCQRIRQHDQVPIIMVTARSDELDTVVGLELGADDYIIKPFRFRELLARMHAVMRRHTIGAQEQISPPPLLRSGDLALNPSQYRVQRGERLLVLKPRAFELLHFFMRHPQQVLRREQLIQHVWQDDVDADTRTIDVHVRWIREQIEDDPSQPRRLLTLRHIGYQFMG